MTLKYVEEILSNEKIEIDKLEAPEIMENKIRKAIENAPKRKIRHRFSVRRNFTVAASIIILFMVYNFDVLAS